MTIMSRLPIPLGQRCYVNFLTSHAHTHTIGVRQTPLWCEDVNGGTCATDPFPHLAFANATYGVREVCVQLVVVKKLTF